MKTQLSLFTFAGLLAATLAGLTQTAVFADDTPAAAAVETPASTTVQPSAAEPAATAKVGESPAAPTSAPAASDSSVAATKSDDSSTAAPAEPAAVATDVAASGAPATPAAAAAEAAASAPAAAPAGQSESAPQTGAVIPLIVMDEVPLTDAIRNLARQAGINYMLDPRIAFGQVGADGKPGPQPVVSIRWENVTAEQALNALLSNYNLQLVPDPKSKISRITDKDPAAPDPLSTKVVQLKFASPSNIVASVQNTFTDKRSKVIADVRTSQLVVLSTEKEMVEVEKLISKLDTQTRQVLIETRLMETLFNPTTSKGIDWSGTLQAQHLNFGNNVKLNSPSESVNNTLATTLPKMLFDTSRGFNPATAFLDADGVSAVLSFLNTYSETKVLSTPRTVTLDNDPALIEVGTMFPIVNVTAGTANTTGGSQVSYSNLTVRLEVTPRISANNYVNLRVSPRVLRLGPQVKSTVAGQVSAVYEFLTRQIDTTVMIPSGNTLLMGGLVQDDIRTDVVKVPILGDIPVLGQIFRSDAKARNKSNLLVFITPTIIQESDFQPTKTDFLKNPVPTKDYLEDDWSFWNSGKPADFSKSKSTDQSAASVAPSGEKSQVATFSDVPE